MRPLRLLLALLLPVAVLAMPAAAATSTATIAVSSAAPVYGTAVTVSGRVSYVPTGTKVMLQRSLGTGWRYVRTLRTSSTGRWSTTYLATLGMNHLRVVIPPSGSRPTVVSPTVVVSAQLRTSPTPAVALQPVQATGQLRTAVQRPVQIQASRNGTVATTTGVTNTSGVFTVTTTLPGTAQVRVVAPRTTVGSTTYDAFTTPWKLVDVVDSPMTSTPVPTVSGQPVVDGHLVAAPGTWDEGVSLTYQWRRAGVAIAGASGSTYDPVAADVGSPISVAVTGTRPGFAAVTRTSAPTASVVRATLQPATPTISGGNEPGESLSAAPGTWVPSPVQFSYRWLRGDVAIPGATSSTYTLTDADRGSLLAVEVTGSKAGYVTVTRTSALRSVPGPQSSSKIARALETFRAALARADQEPVDIFVGPSDSLADGARATSIEKRWISVFRDDLRALHQPAGVEGGFGYLDPFNWGQFPDNPISYVNGVGVFEQGFGRQTLGLFGPTQTITVEDRFTDLDIVYSGWTGAAGSFTYSVDGGPEVKVDTGGKPTTRGGYVQRISGLAAGTHTVVMRGAGGGNGNPAIVEGVMLYVGDRERGVRVWEGGASARRAFDYVAPDDAWATSLKEVHPDLVIVPIGSNDFALGVSAVETEGRIREIIATIRSHVDTDPSIILMPYYDRPTGGTGTWAAYEEMYARIAATDPDIAVFDLAPLFGDYGSAQRSGLMAADHIHPSDSGYALISRELTEFVTGG